MDERIRQFTVLTRVKAMREDKALEALQSARRELRQAEDRESALAAEVEESRRTLHDRIDVVYSDVMGKVIDQDGLDAVKQRAAEVERVHMLLVDRRDRAAHVVQKKRDAVGEAARVYRLAQRDHETFADLLTDMKRDAADAAVAREEIEVEDLFARPRNRFEGAA